MTEHQELCLLKALFNSPLQKLRIELAKTLVELDLNVVAYCEGKPAMVRRNAYRIAADIKKDPMFYDICPALLEKKQKLEQWSLEEIMKREG